MTTELQKQIEQEAKDYAQKRHDDLGDKKNLHRKTLLRYAHQAGATQYADLWQRSETSVKERGAIISTLNNSLTNTEAALREAEQRADRYEKALKEIYGHAGFVPHKHEMITIAREALTPKTGEDE